MNRHEMTHETRGGRGRYAIALPGGEEAELTTSELRPGLIVADHTYVPDSARGQGLAQQMVERLFSDARRDGIRVVPGCSYVRAYAARHRDATADVISES